MQQIQRNNTGLAAVLAASFSQRVQAFSGMNDEQLRHVHKSMTDNRITMAMEHAYARNAFQAASGLKSELSNLSSQRSTARVQLASTPWYRPFKKAGLRASIAATEAKLATVKTKFVQTNASAVLASQRGALAVSPQMKQSDVVLKEIEQTLHARAEERALIMRTQHRARVQAHNDRLAQEQLARDNPSMAMEIFKGMVDDMKEHSAEMTEMAIDQFEQSQRQGGGNQNRQHRNDDERDYGRDIEQERPSHRKRQRGG